MIRRMFTIATIALSVIGMVALPANAETESDQPTVEQQSTLDSYPVSGKQSSGITTAVTGKDGLSTATAIGSRTASYYRGSWLLWTKDYVDFTYDWSKVRSSSCRQSRGYVFPNKAWNKGCWKTRNWTSQHRYRFKNRIGAGTVSPWGDVDLYTYDVFHAGRVSRDGSWSMWRE